MTSTATPTAATLAGDDQPSATSSGKPGNDMTGSGPAHYRAVTWTGSSFDNATRTYQRKATWPNCEPQLSKASRLADRPDAERETRATNASRPTDSA